jgi:F0F1-type ATP synthase gamma subunit
MSHASRLAAMQRTKNNIEELIHALNTQVPEFITQSPHR